MAYYTVLRTMSIWWNWHICTGMGFNACGSPFMPSITMPYIRNPLLLNHSTPSTYWATVSWRTYLCHKTIPRSASLITIRPKFLPQYVVSVCTVTSLCFAILWIIPHALQIPAYGPFADAILGRKLFQCLFALYIVADPNF